MIYLRAARDFAVWALIGATILLGGCAITGTFGYQSLVRLRVPVLCLDDGRCFVPIVSTNTNAATSFRGGTQVTDGLSVGGFKELAPSETLIRRFAETEPDEAIHLELGLDPPAVPVTP